MKSGFNSDVALNLIENFIDGRQDFTTESILNVIPELFEDHYKKIRRPLAKKLNMKVKELDEHRRNGKPMPILSLAFNQIHNTDLGNAKRFARQHSEIAKYCHSQGRWYIWDNKRWRPDDRGIVELLAKDTVLNIYNEAAHTKDEGFRKSLAKWALKSEAREKIKSMIHLARSEPEISILPEEFDRDPWLLNVENGTIDLRTGVIKPHDREDFITKLAPVEYKKSADCPKFKNFLKYIFQNSKDPDALIEFLQRLFGYALTGKTTEDIFPIFWGSGANGKSTLLETIKALLGDYGKTAAPDAILIRRGDKHPTALADLYGARFVTVQETEEGTRLAESLVKQLTGGDKIKARLLYQNYFEFTPTFKIFLATNHKPIIHGTDYAIWRRILLIPFTFTIPPEKRDPKVRDSKFQDEWPGVLNWLIEGCLKWQKEDLNPPEEVKAATEIYRSESDIIAEWLQERTVTGRQYRTAAKELYEDYKKYIEKNGERAISKNIFGRKLVEKGYLKTNRGGKIFYTGIGLKQENDDEEPPF